MTPRTGGGQVARRRHVATAVVLFTAVACGAGGQPAIEVGPAVAAAPRGGVTQVVLEVANTGDGLDRLVAVDTDAALGAEIHRTRLDGGAAMEQVASVEVPPGERVVFERDRLHLMLVAPRPAVTPGGSFELVLEFERSGTRRVQVRVVPEAELPG